MTYQCDHPMRSGSCELDEGHRGRHSTVAFYCDACGHMRRGHPHLFAFERQSDGVNELIGDFCFMCCEVYPRLKGATQ
jgi:hypothetical protein